MEMGLTTAVRLNPLGLSLPRRSVRERFRLTSIAVREIVAQMARRHRAELEMRVDPIIRGGMVVALEVSLEGEKARFREVVRTLKRYLEHEDGEEELFDCGEDVEGFAALARQEIPSTVRANRDGFSIRYSVARGGIFVKELLALPEDEPEKFHEHLVGKTMFRDYDPEEFTEESVDGLFDGLDRFFGLLRESLEDVLRAGEKAFESRDDEDPWNQSVGKQDGSPSTVVVQWLETDGSSEFAETMTFYDRKGRVISTDAYSDSEFSEEGEISRWRSLLDIQAFLNAKLDEVWFAAVRTSGRDGRQLATLYMRNVKVLRSWEKAKLHGVAYLPLYEFFCNYGLASLAAENYAAYGIEIDATPAAAVLSVLGRWERQSKEVSDALRSLEQARANLAVIDVRYAVDVAGLLERVKKCISWAGSKNAEIRIVAKCDAGGELGRIFRELFGETPLYGSIEEALKEPPMDFLEN